MTIDEGIRHAEEVAEGLEKKANTYGIKRAYIPKSQEPVDCISCAADHRQLAEWLTELKEWKKNPFLQIRTECRKNYYCNNCAFINHCPFANGNRVAAEYPMDWVVY